MAISSIRERARQARALILNEGAGTFARRALAAIGARIYDSGNVIWIHRDTTPATSAEGADELVVTLAEPGSRAETVANELRPLTTAIRAERLAAGGRRYVIHRDNLDDPIYTGWVYEKRLPVAEHLGISLPMPEHSAGIEDSYVPPAHRGAHVAIAVIDALAVALYERGIRQMLSKIDEENKAALGAARISGWQQFGQVHGTVWFNRFPRWRVHLDEPVLPELKKLESSPRGWD